MKGAGGGRGWRAARVEGDTGGGRRGNSSGVSGSLPSDIITFVTLNLTHSLATVLPTTFVTIMGRMRPTRSWAATNI